MSFQVLTCLNGWQGWHLAVITVTLHAAVSEAIDSRLIVCHHHHVRTLCVAAQLSARPQAPAAAPALYSRSKGRRRGHWQHLLRRCRTLPSTAVRSTLIYWVWFLMYIFYIDLVTSLVNIANFKTVTYINSFHVCWSGPSWTCYFPNIWCWITVGPTCEIIIIF